MTCVSSLRAWCASEACMLAYMRACGLCVSGLQACVVGVACICVSPLSLTPFRLNVQMHDARYANTHARDARHTHTHTNARTRTHTEAHTKHTYSNTQTNQGTRTHAKTCFPEPSVLHYNTVPSKHVLLRRYNMKVTCNVTMLFL